MPKLKGTHKKAGRPASAKPKAVQKVVLPEPLQGEGGIEPKLDLAAIFRKKEQVAEELQAVEKQIYDLETRYLEQSHPLGNALKGYEGLLTQSAASTRRTLVRQEDRLFSNSSVSGAPY